MLTFYEWPHHWLDINAGMTVFTSSWIIVTSRRGKKHNLTRLLYLTCKNHCFGLRRIQKPLPKKQMVKKNKCQKSRRDFMWMLWRRHGDAAKQHSAPPLYLTMRLQDIKQANRPRVRSYLEAEQDAEVPRRSVVERVNQIHTFVHAVLQGLRVWLSYFTCQLRLFITVSVLGSRAKSFINLISHQIKTNIRSGIKSDATINILTASAGACWRHKHSSLSTEHSRGITGRRGY